MNTFIERFLDGKVADPMAEAFAEVGAWHDSDSTAPLHQWLGMTESEFKDFIEDPQAFFATLPDTWWKSCIVTREQARERLAAVERELAARIGIPPVEFSVLVLRRESLSLIGIPSSYVVPRDYLELDWGHAAPPLGEGGLLVATCAASPLMHPLPPKATWEQACEIAAQLERSHLGGTLTDIIRRMILGGALLEDAIWDDAGHDLVAEWHSAYSWYLSYDRDDETITAEPEAP